MRARLRRWRLLTQPCRPLLRGRSVGGRYCPDWCTGNCHIPIEGIDADDLVAIHNGQPAELKVCVDTEVHDFAAYPTQVDSLRTAGQPWVHFAGDECDMSPGQALQVAAMLIEAARVAVETGR
jgi:hypothetical protein